MAGPEIGTDEALSPNPAYSYRPSLIGPTWQFELTDRGLAWRVGGRRGMWPYASIARIRLSFRPTSMQAQRFRADIRDDAGRSIAVISASWQTAAVIVAQGDSYRRFVNELHARIAANEGRPLLLAGVTRLFYFAGWTAFALVNAAILGLFVRGLAVASYSGMLFLLGFAILFGWKIGGLLYRNRPRVYRLDALPRDLIP